MNRLINNKFESQITSYRTLKLMNDQVTFNNKIKTFDNEFDKYFNGLTKGDVYALVGKVSSGKTSLLLQYSINLVLHKKHVLFINNKSPLSKIFKIIFTNCRDFEQLDNNIDKSTNTFGDLLKFDNTTIIENIINRSYNLYDQRKLDILIVENIEELVSYGHSNNIDSYNIEYILSVIKVLAHELNVPVIFETNKSIKNKNKYHKSIQYFNRVKFSRKIIDDVIYLNNN